MTDEMKKKLEQDAKSRSLHSLRVYVVGGGFQYVQMFYEAGFLGARNIDDCDIVCFTGGADVDPALYGEKALPETGYDRSRDDKETIVYADALAAEKPMIGICRGSQFLNVMNGGKLWQDVDNHAVHDGHDITDLKTGEIVEKMTSTHHQQMIPSAKADVLALACLTTMKKRDGDQMVRKNPDLDDVEVVWYEETRALCFQPHPEFAHGSCRNYFLDLVDDYVVPNT
jgi:gamma-glutamyl-gamma-aminobutyrate hydrolase PuuD